MDAQDALFAVLCAIRPDSWSPHATLPLGNTDSSRLMHFSRDPAQCPPSSGTLRLRAAGVPSTFFSSTQSVFLTLLLHEPCAHARSAPRHDVNRSTCQGPFVIATSSSSQSEWPRVTRWRTARH